ncbi:hypothetical protein L7F22_006370 [Adiantum nelumboides]|nr:hypothetical protein [Adiantum nelumboides]
MEAVGGHNALLGIHNPVGRKEWRVVTEGSARDRLAGDGSVEHSRVNGSARMRPLHSDNPRNGRIFHSGASSGSSSDSDHHTSDAKHAIAASHESFRQNGEDIKLYDEALHTHEQEPVSNGHTISPSNGLPLDFGGLNSSKHETLEQRLHDVIRQREQLQRLEAELRAQFIARSEIIRVQNSFDEQTKQHASIVSNLQEQLQERDHRLHELEQKLEERERQLHANQKEASEAVNQVWAKDGLLREQTSELATLRRERETLIAEQKATLTQFEADRTQLVSRLQDLEEQVQEKDRQLQEIDEQHRSAQETLAYKDEQLREAQAWVQRAQELDAYYANTHNSLHAELRDRNEQINQLWLGQQRQLAEVERYHSQTIQRLRMEVAEAREQNRMLKSGSSGSIDFKSEQSLPVSSGDNDHSSATDLSLKLRKGAASGSNQVEHTVAPLPASPVLGATAPVLAGNPIPVLHQFAGQPHGIIPTIPPAPAHNTQSSFSNPVVIHQQALHSKLIQQPQTSQRFTHPQPLPVYSHFPETKSPITIHPRGVHQHHQQFDQQSRDQLSVQAGLITHEESSPFIEKQVCQAIQEKHVTEEQNLQGFGKTVASQDPKEQQFEQQQEEKDKLFDDKNSEKDSMTQVDSIQVFSQHPSIHQMELPNNSVVTDVIEQHHVHDSKIDEQQVTVSQASVVQSIPSQDSQVNQGPNDQTSPTVTASVLQQATTAEGIGKSPMPMLLDEKSLLACLVRAIPSEASACIKISTTLPNRLGKMLAPLHWHDYKKQYGRLDDFISAHPKLFVIDGDFVHLREGAHAIISATTAVAKVAAVAAAPSSFGTNWPPTVAITPVAQSQVQRTRRNIAPVFIASKEAPGSAGKHTKHEILFSHVQMNRLHQGFLSKDALGEKQAPQHQQRNVPFNGVTSSNGSKLMSALGSIPDGIHSGAVNAEFVDVSSAPYGALTASRKADMLFGGRQGARPNVAEPEPFIRKELSGLSQSQENRIPRSS